MQLKQHVIASAAVSGAIFAATGSKAAAASSFAAGVLIDLDHVLDYWFMKPFSFDVGDFFYTCEETLLTSCRLFLHSLELLLVLGLAAWLFRSPWLVGLVIGMGQHLALDQAMNPVHEKSYIFMYRLAHRFRTGAVFTDKRKS